MTSTIYTIYTIPLMYVCAYILHPINQYSCPQPLPLSHNLDKHYNLKSKTSDAKPKPKPVNHFTSHPKQYLPLMKFLNVIVPETSFESTGIETIFGLLVEIVASSNPGQVSSVHHLLPSQLEQMS